MALTKEQKKDLIHSIEKRLPIEQEFIGYIISLMEYFRGYYGKVWLTKALFGVDGVNVIFGRGIKYPALRFSDFIESFCSEDGKKEMLSDAYVTLHKLGAVKIHWFFGGTPNWQFHVYIVDWEKVAVIKSVLKCSIENTSNFSVLEAEKSATTNTIDTEKPLYQYKEFEVFSGGDNAFYFKYNGEILRFDSQCKLIDKKIFIALLQRKGELVFIDGLESFFDTPDINYPEDEVRRSISRLRKSLKGKIEIINDKGKGYFLK